jgi:hypothetical protein
MAGRAVNASGKCTQSEGDEEGVKRKRQDEGQIELRHFNAWLAGPGEKGQLEMPTAPHYMDC